MSIRCILVFALLSPWIVACSEDAASERALVGTWRTDSPLSTSRITFKSDRTFEMTGEIVIVGELTAAGVWDVVDGELVLECDPARSPLFGDRVWIDEIVRVDDDTLIRRDLDGEVQKYTRVGS